MDVVLSGRYQLVSPLGQGGMGEVWKATDTMLNRPVAVKLIRLGTNPSASGHDEALKRFRREAQAVAALNHPNIVTAYDFGIDADTPYLVMELIDGVSLSQELNERDADDLGALPLDRVFAIAADVLAGLGAAHAAGVIHRDLKPANLMTVTATGRVKIVDFGIARGSDLSKLTQTGGFVGTVAYMAPELMTTRGKVTGKADLYSFGCVMYELLTGGPAFDAAEPAQFIAAHMHATPFRLRELLPGAPEPLEALLLELLEKKPENRPADAEEVAERLAEFAPTPARRTRRTRPTPATLVESGELPQVTPAAKPAATKALGATEAAAMLEGDDVVHAAASVGVEPVGAESVGVESVGVEDLGTDEAPAALVADDPAAPDSPVVAGSVPVAGSTAIVGAVPAAGVAAVAAPVAKVPAARTPADNGRFAPGRASLDDDGTRAEPPPTPVRRIERPVGDPEPDGSRAGLYTLVGIIAAVVVGAIVWLLIDSGNTKSPSAGSTPKTSAGASRSTSASQPAASGGPTSGGPATTPLAVTTMAAGSGCNAPSQLSFNKAGTLLAGGGPTAADSTGTGAACVWNVGSRSVAVTSSSYGTVFSVSFAAGSDTELALMSSASTPINVIDTSDPGRLRNSLASDVNWPAHPEAVAYSPDGGHLAVTDRDSDLVQTFRIGPGVHTVDAQIQGIPRGSRGGYGNLAYSPNGSLLVRGEVDGFTVFTPSAGSPRPWHFAATTSGPMPAAFAGNGHLVTCHGDELAFWDLNANAPKATAKLSGGTCYALAVSPDGSQFAVTMVSGSNAAVNVGKLPAGWK